MNKSILIILALIAAIGSAVAWWANDSKPWVKTGKLSLSSLPLMSELSVIIDDKTQAEKLSRWHTPKNGMFTVELPVGEHTVKLSRESAGYAVRSKVHTVEIKEGKSTFLEIPVKAELEGSSKRMLKLAYNFRSSKNRPKEFIRNQHGIVTDTRSKLQWMACSIGQQWDGNTCTGNATALNWEQAQSNKQHTFAGHSDWRVPTIFELQTLVYCSSNKDMGFDHKNRLSGCEVNYDDDRTNANFRYKKPTIVQSVFPNTLQEIYWSATKAGSKGEYIFFEHGVSSDRNINDKGYLRLVRDTN